MTAHSRREAEKNRFEAAVEQTAEAVVITDKDGTIQYVNPAFERLTGYSREEALGQNPWILKSGKHDAAFYNAMWGKLVHGKVWRGHFINKKKDGTFFEEEATISPVKNSAGEIVNFVAVKRDVTRAVFLETQLRQTRKMEAIGTLAGGIAHDFNNILGIIFGNADMALDDIPNGNPAAENIRDLIEAADRARNLVKQLLEFTRQPEQEYIPLMPGPLIKESLKFFRSTSPATISIVQDISTDCGTILSDPSQLQQLLMNLCLNAVQAMEEKGALEVIGKVVELNVDDIVHQADIRPGSYFKLSVGDTGVGMDTEMQQRIFDPFSTTNEVGTGVGMGLSIVRSIVLSHGGMITVDSKLGEGSTFHVFLPQVTPEEIQAPEETNSLPHGSERILFVDDEPMLLKMDRKMLERQGYLVTTKSSSIDALKTFQSNPDNFDLVITDQTMPDMTGLELAAELLKIRPDIPIILCTGYSARISRENAREFGIRSFFHKPFDRSKLVKTIRKILDAS